MHEPPRFGRRRALGVSLGAGALVGCDTRPPVADAHARAAPLAQDFVTVLTVPRDGRAWYAHDPGLARLPQGRLVVAAPCLRAARTWPRRSQSFMYPTAEIDDDDLVFISRARPSTARRSMTPTP